MEKFPAQKGILLPNLLRTLKLRTFTTLKSTRAVSESQLRVLIALIAVYRDVVDDPCLSEKILMENDGVNQEVFRGYFDNATHFFKRIEATQKILLDGGLRPENVRFAKQLISDFRTAPTSGAAGVDEAVRNIFEFLKYFINYYEANYSTETRKRFFFAQRLNYAPTQEPEPPRPPPRSETHFRLSSDTESRGAPCAEESTPAQVTRNPLNLRGIANGFAVDLAPAQYKRKLGVPSLTSRSRRSLPGPPAKNFSGQKPNLVEPPRLTRAQTHRGEIKAEVEVEVEAAPKAPNPKRRTSSAVLGRGTVGGLKVQQLLTTFATSERSLLPPAPPALQFESEVNGNSTRFESNSVLPEPEVLLRGIEDPPVQRRESRSSDFERPDGDYPDQSVFLMSEAIHRLQEKFESSSHGEEESQNSPRACADKLYDSQASVPTPQSHPDPRYTFSHQRETPQPLSSARLPQSSFKSSNSKTNLISNPSSIPNPNPAPSLNQKPVVVVAKDVKLLLSKKTRKLSTSIPLNKPPSVRSSQSVSYNPQSSLLFSTLQPSLVKKNIFSTKIPASGISGRPTSLPLSRRSDLSRPRSKDLKVRPQLHPLMQKSQDKVKTLPAIPNNSITLNAHSIIKNYIDHSEVRERYVAEEKELGKEKIEINKLRIEAGRAKFMVEKEAALKTKGEFEVKEKEINFYREFNERYRHFAQDKKQEDQEFLRKIRSEAKEDLRNSKRVVEFGEENKNILKKLELAKQKQNEVARIVGSHRATDRNFDPPKTEDQERREFSSLRKKVEVMDLDRQKSELKSELSYFKGLAVKQSQQSRNFE